MAALLDIEDIINALGRAPTSAEEATQWQFYIESVSAFINGYVTAQFGLLTGDVVRRQADYYGVVDLGGDPISSVTSVKNWRTGVETTWDFDGLNKIFYLQANETVDITYTHGYAVVPDDVKYMATQAVLGVLGLGATGQITSFTVGDVTEVYSNNSDNGVTTTVVSLSKQVLSKYTDEDFTYRVGGKGQFPNANVLPTL